jgi:chemotaxis protein CheC
MLTPNEKDILTEILNIHMGKSASQLSDMVNQKVILSVPEVELRQGSELGIAGFQKDNLFEDGNLVVTSVAFGDAFKGHALVIFPEEKAKILVNACLGNELTDSIDQNLSGEDADVIREICNVILNSLVGEFGNLLDVRLEYSSFEMGISRVANLEESSIIPDDSQVLVLYISFFLTVSQVRGVLLIALSGPSFQMLTEKIDGMLRDLDV